MATENIQITLKLNDDGASAQLKNFKGEIVASKIPIADLRKEFGNFVLHAKQSERTLKTTRQSFDNLGKSIGGFKTATGAASASALELGRVVSDMPYGIRGVANNISQFASMMAMSSRATDAATGKIVGLSGAIKGLWTALKGPLGILLAIQAVVAGLDWFYGANKKVEGSSEELTKVFGKETTSLMVLKSALDDSSISMETKNELVKNANKEFKELNIVLDKNGKLTDESAKRLDNLSLSFIKNAKARAIAKLIQDEMAKQAAVEVKKTGESLAWYETAYYTLQSKILGMTTAVTNAIDKDNKNKNEKIKESADIVNKYLTMLKANDAELAKLLINGGSGNTSKNKFIDLKYFQANILSIEKIIKDARDRDIINSAKTELEKIKAKERIEKLDLNDSLAKSKKNNEDKYLDYLVAIDKQLEKKKITEEQYNNLKEQADRELENKNKKSYENYLKALALIKNKYAGLIDVFNRKDDSGDTGKRDSTDEYLTKQLEKYAKYAETAKGILSSITSFIDGEFDRELAIEKNKTNAINNELNQRLLNENLSKDERKSIQNQIAKNDELLRQKQEKIEKRRFEMNKAANIAKAVVDTYAAAVGVMKDASGGFFSRLAQAIPTIAFGLAQVATIARQKFVSSAGARTPVRGGGGGSSSGGNDRSFNFNLVGNTQANQIADAIQGQFKQPLKAFVVSRDITTQQELDANIKGSASF